MLSILFTLLSRQILGIGITVEPRIDYVYVTYDILQDMKVDGIEEGWIHGLLLMDHNDPVATQHTKTAKVVAYQPVAAGLDFSVHNRVMIKGPVQWPILTPGVWISQTLGILHFIQVLRSPKPASGLLTQDSRQRFFHHLRHFSPVSSLLKLMNPELFCQRACSLFLFSGSREGMTMSPRDRAQSSEAGSGR